MERHLGQGIFGWAKLFSLVLFVACICGTSAIAATPTYSVSGTVTAGSTGVPAIHVNLAGGAVNKTISTDSHGNYNFTNIAAGSYTITPSAIGCTFSPLDIPVTVSANSTGNNFSVTFTISGKVTVSGAGDPSSVTVTLSGPSGTVTTATDGSGNYSFSSLSQGTYTVTPTKLAYTLSPSKRTVSVKSAGTITANFVEKEVTYSISGTASVGNPIANAPVDLVDSAGQLVTPSPITSSVGHFSIHSTGIKPPFLLRVPANSDYLYSVSSDWKASATINITPLTDIIVRSWYGAKGVDMTTAFADPVTNPPPTPTDVLVLRTMVQNTVQTWLQSAGVKTAGFNAISTPFTANGKGVDAVLNLINEVPSTGGVINVTINGNQTTQNPASENMVLSSSSPNPTTQNTTFSSSNGSLTITTTATVSGNTGSTTTTTSVLPTSQAEEDALAGINTTITNFVNTVNKKGHSLQASDLAPYIDPNFYDNGMNKDLWTANMIDILAGYTMSYSGLQINSLDTVNNVANVWFQVTSGNQTNGVTTTFKLVGDTWLVSGNGYEAQIALQTWAWDNPSQNPEYSYTTQFGVYDPQSDHVQTVTVYGPGVGSQDAPVPVPMICDSDPLSGLPQCGNSHGNDYTQRGFELSSQSFSQPFWPAVGSTYTYTVTTSGGDKTYTYTVGNEYGFDASQNIVYADYPLLKDLNPDPTTLTLTQILNGVTVTGSVYIPIWASIEGHFNFEGPGGENNNVSNRDIYVKWLGTAVPGQWNSFTITIPKSTNVTPAACDGGGSGPCYNITFEGQTGQIEGGWFGFDAMDPTVDYGGSTNYGVEIH